MCTVTIIPLDVLTSTSANVRNDAPPVHGGIRLACNRDESRRRPPALSPQIRRFGARRAILPIDPISDGTWIAVNDAGLILTLLNVYQPSENPMLPSSSPAPVSAVQSLTPHSRGIIIPSLLHLPGVEALVDQIPSLLDPARFPPFRLIAVDESLVLDTRGDHQCFHMVTAPRRTEPLLYTSSGLGDHIVEGPRRALFQEFFSGNENWLRQQEAYHHHFWPDRRDISVCMSREKARTVSYTVVEVAADRMTLQYHPEAPDVPAATVSFSLPRAKVRA